MFRRGNQRHVSVYKSKGKGENSEEKGNMSHLTLSQEAKEILNDLFIRYPPGEGVTSEQIPVKHVEKSERRKERQRDDIFCRPPMDKADITKKVESLSARLEKAANLKQVPDLLSCSHEFVDFISWLGRVFTGVFNWSDCSL